ncbi:MAG: OmpA family protein [Ignavibacteria bacterium]|nr:OmpA family protein [Ignavibacteria bacterium]
MKINLFKLLVLISIILIQKINCQAPFGAFIDYQILPNLDTLILNRSYGNWWFGLFGNISYNVNFGKLQIPERPYLPLSDTLNRLLTHNSRNGFNVLFGLTGEYVPKGSFWGGMVRLALLEKRVVESRAELSKDHNYSMILNFYSLVLSPSVRYNFSIEGLHTFAGFDLEYFFNDKSRLQEVEYKDGSRLVTDWVLSASPKQLRLNLHAGIGWDLFFLSISKMFRVRAKPFISFHFGTTVFSGYSSSLNTFHMKGGFSLLFGPDEVTSEYRKFDSTYVRPPEAVAQLPQTVRRGVSFPGFERTPLFASMELSMVPAPQIIAEAGITQEEQIATEIKMPETPSRITINPNQKIVLQGYTRSDVISLTSSMRNTLDALAEFLLVNPEYIVVIEGHSDNQGTLEQNTERGRLRAQAAANYLISRKVSPSRIRTASRSSFYPIADNTSEEGRRKNRRVEIVLVK